MWCHMDRVRRLDRTGQYLAALGAMPICSAAWVETRDNGGCPLRLAPPAGVLDRLAA
jgi:hypothetical protein